MRFIRFILSLFRPRSIETVRASSRKQREADQEYGTKHARLAVELGLPVPAHLRGYQPKGRGRV